MTKTRVFNPVSEWFRHYLLNLFLVAGIFSWEHASAQTLFTNLHNFDSSDGSAPQSTLVASGTFIFGTTTHDGSGGGFGSVFRINTDGSSYTNLHPFTSGFDEGFCQGGVILVGNALYGAAYFGGSNGTGYIFGINTNGQNYTNLYDFAAIGPIVSSNATGAYPQSGLAFANGRLYGSAYEGGLESWGALFSLSTNGGGFTNLHSFVVSDGQYPAAGVVLSSNVFYGPVTDGGANNTGTIFMENTNGLAFTNIYSFDVNVGSPYTNGTGATPAGGLVISGNTLYGVAEEGGSNACGTIFKVNTDGSGFTRLHMFNGKQGLLHTNSDGANPEAGLLLFSNTLYGTAMNGGVHGNGTIFSLRTDGSGFTTLYSFSSTNNASGTNLDGAHPIGGLVIAGNSLYGTTSAGGANNYGVIFNLAIAPPLFIARSGTNVIVNWPTNFTGFNLQYATNLAPPVTWTTIPVAGGATISTNATTNTFRFYRLMSP